MILEIKELVREKTEINVDLKTRRIEVVQARALYFFLCRKYTDESLTSLVKSISHLKNHVTVHHAFKMFDTYKRENKNISDAYSEICSIIDFYIYNKCKSLRDAQKQMPLSNNERSKYINTHLEKNGLIDCIGISDLICTIPKKHLETVKKRLETIIKCLPKD